MRRSTDSNVIVMLKSLFISTALQPIRGAVDREIADRFSFLECFWHNGGTVPDSTNDMELENALLRKV
jgi:hypothetical protein